MDETVWQEIAKWFAGVLAGLTTMFMVILRSWAGDRFDAMSDRIDKSDDRQDKTEATLDSHEERLADHHENLQIALLHIDNGKEDRRRIETSVKELREENREGFRSISERLDKIAQSK